MNTDHNPNLNDIMNQNYTFNPFKEPLFTTCLHDNSAEQHKTSNQLLPLALLQDFDIDNPVHEEDELEESFNNLNRNANEENDDLIKHHYIWHNHTLKAPNIHNKEKYLSLDNIKGLTQLRYVNPSIYTTPIKQMPMMNSLNDYQKFDYSLMPQHSPMNYNHNAISYQMQNKIYSGTNSIMSQYINMPIKQNQIGKIYPRDNNNWQTKNNTRKGSTSEKLLSNPKRIYSSPVDTGFTNIFKKKTSRKSSLNEKITTFEDLIKVTDSNLTTYILTQKGSRDAQKILKKITPTNLEILIKNISSNLGKLMIDKYANYFCQELIKNCSADLRMIVLQSIKKDFIEISCHSCGTHSLQSFIEISDMPNEQELLRQYIETDVMKLALNSKGTHVLQKFISSSRENLLGKIPEILLNNFEKLINDSFGVCVLIKCYQNITNKTLKDKLRALISQNTLEITQNPFGNYVVQAIITDTEMGQCKDILKVICDNFFSLSMQKYSSNVVESTVNLIEEDVLKTLFYEILSSGKLTLMIKNIYGNYVIEKMIGRMNKDDKLILFQELKKSGKDKTLSSSFINMLI